MKKKIIITSVGSLVGQNILDSLTNRRENLVLIGTNSLAEVANNFRCDKSYLISESSNTERYIEELIKIIKVENPDLVIPGRDEEVVILARLTQVLPEYKNKLLTGTEYFARCMDNKIKSYQFALKFNLPFAPTVQSGTKNSKKEVEILISKFGFPLIAKPSKGNGSRGIWIVLNKSQLNKVILATDFAIQPFFGQTEDITLDTSFGVPLFWEVPESRLFAAQVIIDKNQEINSIFSFISKMVYGKCERMDRYENPEMKKIVVAFAEAAISSGWRGPFNVQLKQDSKHGFQVIEMNGRFSGGTSGRFHFGFDEVGIVIEDWIEKGIVVKHPHSVGINVVTKILSDFKIEQGHVDALEEHKVWPPFSNKPSH